MEVFEVGVEEAVGALAFRHGGGEDLLPELFKRDARNAGQPLGNIAVALGGGGRFEHDRIRQDGRAHQPGELRMGHEALFLEHAGQDRVGAAHDVVAEEDGREGLDIRKAVVVDDAQNLSLVQPGHGLGDLVVVDQDDLFAAGLDQMVA